MYALALTVSGLDGPDKGILAIRPAHDWILPLIERRCAHLEDPPKPPGGPTTAAAPGPPDDGATRPKLVVPFDPVSPELAADRVLEGLAVDPARLRRLRVRPRVPSRRTQPHDV